MTTQKIQTLKAQRSKGEQKQPDIFQKSYDMI